MKRASQPIHQEEPKNSVSCVLRSNNNETPVTTAVLKLQNYLKINDGTAKLSKLFRFKAALGLATVHSLLNNAVIWETCIPNISKGC